MRNWCLSALLAMAVMGCAASPADQPGAGSGGSNGGDAQPTGSGGAATGGSGAATGGATGTDAGTGSGGATVGGTGGSAIDAGGTGGAATDAGGPGDGGTGTPLASAGCAKSGRPAGGRIIVANDHIYDFPATYDGNKPMPLVFVLHGANNPNTLVESQTNGSRLATNFVRVFPKSTGAAWSFGGGTSADMQRLATIYNDLLANHCIDTSRVFLSGHSSGAQMSVQMICVPGGDKRFKAVAPVAASKYCDTLTPIPVLYIQGMMDAMRGGGNGANVVAVFTASNMCTTTSMPYAAIPTCNSTLDGKLVNPGCISYQGCSKPTVWCSHNDNVYNLTDGHEHGWPCFAANGIADFFLSLP